MRAAIDDRPNWRVFAAALTAGMLVVATLASVVGLFEWKARVLGLPIAALVFVPLMFANTAVAAWLSRRGSRPA